MGYTCCHGNIIKNIAIEMTFSSEVYITYAHYLITENSKLKQHVPLKSSILSSGNSMFHDQSFSLLSFVKAQLWVIYQVSGRLCFTNTVPMKEIIVYRCQSFMSCQY